MKNKINRNKILSHIVVFSIFILPVYVFAQGGNSGRGGGLVPCDGINCTYENFIQLIVNVVGFLIQVGIAFSAIIFAWAGWLYMTSGGDESKISQAHELFVKVLWGFLFALGAFLIVQLIASSLGLKTGIVTI